MLVLSFDLGCSYSFSEEEERVLYSFPLIQLESVLDFIIGNSPLSSTGKGSFIFSGVVSDTMPWRDESVVTESIGAAKALLIELVPNKIASKFVSRRVAGRKRLPL